MAWYIVGALVLLRARVNSHIHSHGPPPPTMTLPSGSPTDHLDCFSQEAAMQDSCISAGVGSMSATGLLIGGANMFPNLR